LHRGRRPYMAQRGSAALAASRQLSCHDRTPSMHGSWWGSPARRTVIVSDRPQGTSTASPLTSGNTRLSRGQGVIPEQDHKEQAQSYRNMESAAGGICREKGCRRCRVGCSAEIRRRYWDIVLSWCREFRLEGVPGLGAVGVIAPRREGRACGVDVGVAALIAIGNCWRWRRLLGRLLGRLRRAG
jgi:hypothetical protein